MSAVETGELVIVVDETHEDRACEAVNYRCEQQAVLNVEVTCHCVYALCLRCVDRLHAAFSHGPWMVDCPSCGTSGRFAILRTWPVTQ